MSFRILPIFSNCSISSSVGMYNAVVDDEIILTLLPGTLIIICLSGGGCLSRKESSNVVVAISCFLATLIEA